MKVFNGISNIDESYPYQYYGKALVYSDAKNVEEAVKNLKKYLELDKKGSKSIIKNESGFEKIKDTPQFIRLVAPGVKVDGKTLEFEVPPTEIQGRILLPVRAILESLGAEVKWDPDTKTATATKGSIKVTLTLDSKEATVNGEKVTLDVAAVEKDGRILVPARFIAQSLGAKVDWDVDTETAVITSAK